MKTNLFYKQVQIAKWQLGLILFSCIGTALIIVTGSNQVATAAMWHAGMGILIATGILQFILWISGIINAIRINKLTKSSTLLVIFSIFTFWFVHLIFATKEKKKNKNAIVKDAKTTINYINK